MQEFGGEQLPEEINLVASEIVDCIWAVYKEMGPGLLESIYESCLSKEFQRRNIPFERQKEVPVSYRGESLGEKLRIDLVVREKVLVEVKAVESILSVHKAQLLTYLKLTGFELGLLVNFNTKYLKDDIFRVVLSKKDEAFLCGLCGFAVNDFFLSGFAVKILSRCHDGNAN